MERKKYHNPPVEEAICEFHFSPGADWDYAFHINFLEQLRGEYSGKVRRQQVMEAGLQVGGDQHEAHLTMKQARSRVQYPTRDGKRIVGIGENVLSVHSLRPYEGWDAFRPRVERALRVYEEVAGPAGVTRIAVRYINRIQLPSRNVKLGDYFTAPLSLPDSLNVTVSALLNRTESLFADAPIRLACTFAGVEAPPGCSAFVMDNEVTQDWAQPALPLGEALDSVGRLKTRQTQVFESMITDKAREVFNADNS